MKHNLILDNHSEIYSMLKPWCAGEFWDFSQVQLEPGTYVFGRQQFIEHLAQIKELALNPNYQIVFCNAAEGSWTLQTQVRMLGVEQLILDGKILLVSGGEQQADYPYIQYDHFLCEILRYTENQTAMLAIDSIFSQTHKPYKFLFLNGRGRPHRKYLYEQFRRQGLLDHSLWTMLDSRPSPSRAFNFFEDGVNVMGTVSELRWLPSHYEVDLYRDSQVNPGPSDRTFVKSELFKQEWGEIYLEPRPYVDTYFSLVTETVFEQPWSFRTEKIAKPLMIGHPFIVAGSPGYYRSLHQLGFKTFGHVVDESFDSIENHQDRMNRIIQIVKDLCGQDLDQFQRECYNICKYNQQHLLDLASRLQSDFPERFFQFIQ